MIVLTPVTPIRPENLERVHARLTILVKLNGLYRQLVWLWDRIWCLRTCVGDTISKETTAIDTQMNIVRSAEPAAKLTYVINLGAEAVIIYESQAPVALALPNIRVNLPMPGRGRIWARSRSGSQSILIVTIRNCACGVEAESDPYENPVGSFLL